MKYTLLCVSILCCVLSCGSKTEVDSNASKVEGNNAVLNDAPTAETPDTIRFTDYVDPEKYRLDETFTYGDENYEVDVLSYSLGDSAFSEIYTDSTTTPHKVRFRKYHNNNYQLKVRRDGNLLYNRTFTKKDFLGMGDDYRVKIAYPGAPVPVGFTSNGWAVFNLWLAPYGSDYGVMAFFVLDDKGELIRKEIYGSTGGNGCGSISLSGDRKYILTCNSLYGIDGSEFKFGRNHMVATTFLTDSSFAAITDIVTKSEIREKKEFINGKTYTIKYLHEERDTIIDNLVFYDLKGRKLAGYRYDGFSMELDYNAPVELIPSINKLFLLDADKQEIYLVNAADPRQMQTLKLINLKQLTDKEAKLLKPTLELYTLSNKYRFYIDGEQIKYNLAAS